MNKFKVADARFRKSKEAIWGQHLWARGYLAVSSGTITDEVTLPRKSREEVKTFLK